MTKIAYLINQYPKVSHSFIRREIQALENLGVNVFRFSVRSVASELVDKNDLLELEKTKFILKIGLIGLLSNIILVVLSKPINFIKALLLAIKSGWRKDRGVIVHLAYLAEACVFYRWVSTLKITHVHAHFAFNPSAVAMLCHALGGPPYSFTTHGPESIDRAIILSLNEKIKRASFAIAISSFARSQLYRWCDYKYWSKIHIVHCGLTKQFLTHSLTPVPQNSHLVCVARLSEQKGHFVLLEAIHNLVMEGLEPKLVLVGDGPLRPQIEDLILQLNLQNNVKITGWISNKEVRQQILDSKAMVLASFAEGLPVVIMEALALGRPVISTYVAGVPEILENNTCGYIVPPGSVEKLASAIRKVLYLSPDELNQMVEIGLEKVRQQHDIDKEARKLLNLFTKANL